VELSPNFLTLRGPAGSVLKAEIYFLQELIMVRPYTLINEYSELNENLSRNLESVMKMTRIFNSMIWRWENQKQIKMIINSNTATKTFIVSIEGRDSEVRTVTEELKSFQSWLQNCAVIKHPNAGK
jgi:hypothetical protein